MDVDSSKAEGRDILDDDDERPILAMVIFLLLPSDLDFGAVVMSLY